MAYQKNDATIREIAMQFHSAGLTLLELLLVLSIFLILQFVALPSLRHLLLLNRMTVIVDRLGAEINAARNAAIERRCIVRFCPSASGKACAGDWRDGQMIMLPTLHTVLRSYPHLPAGYRLIWKSTFNRNRYLEFTAQGFTHGQQGTFYCCSTHNSQYARGLVVSRSGRVRELHDMQKLHTVCD